MDNFLKFAKDLAKKTGKILLKNIDNPHEFKKKNEYIADGVRSLQSDADLEADFLIKSSINNLFPYHNILMEESGFVNKKSSWTWVADPLDGTLAYLRGIKEDFVVSLSLFEDKEIFLGVIYCPGTDELFYSQKGKGAFCNKTRLEVSFRKDLSESHVEIEHNVFRRFNKPKELYQMVYDTRRIRIGDSSSKAYTRLAAGKYEGVIAMYQPLYDCATGMILVQEAGGKFTDFKGRKIKIIFDNVRRMNVVASNGKVHEQIINVLGKNG